MNSSSAKKSSSRFRRELPYSPSPGKPEDSYSSPNLKNSYRAHLGNNQPIRSVTPPNLTPKRTINLTHSPNYDTPTTKSTTLQTKASPLKSMNKIIQPVQVKPQDNERVRKASPSPLSHDHGYYRTNFEASSKYSAQSLWIQVLKFS